MSAIDGGLSPTATGARGTAQIKVLIAEDEESFVDALVVGLEREGFDVTVARDGVEALRHFAADEPDLVLLDVMLPRMSGLDVCRAIRARSKVPIIMVTAKSTEIDTVVGLEVGADDYVAKPYRLRELVSRMRAVLRRTPPTDGPSDAARGRRDRREPNDDRAYGRARARGRRHPARPRPPRVHRPRQRGPATLEGVRAPRAAAGQRRTGRHPRHPDRPGLGLRLRRRHEDPRRPHQAAPRQSRRTRPSRR